MEQGWNSFVGGVWQKEINVRDFIQKNYTPYDGDESFLAGPTEATKELWAQVMELSEEERKKGGVLDRDTKIISRLSVFRRINLLRGRFSLTAVSVWRSRPVKRMDIMWIPILLSFL